MTTSTYYLIQTGHTNPDWIDGFREKHIFTKGKLKLSGFSIAKSSEKVDKRSDVVLQILLTEERSVSKGRMCADWLSSRKTVQERHYVLQ